MHNSAGTVSQTIESVQSQTYKNWEMIIVDDCSWDESVEIVERYMKDDSRIRLIRNRQNKGVAHTRNVAIKNATGRYIAFLDSDDLWRWDKLDKQLGLMRETNSAFCYGMCGVIDDTGCDLQKDRVVPRSIDYKELLKGNPIPCLTVLIDRKLVEQIEMPDIPHEDYACWLNIFGKYDISACGVQSVIADYRISRKTVSSNKIKGIIWTWNIYRKYLKLPLSKSINCFIWYAVRAVTKRLFIGKLVYQRALRKTAKFDQM